MLIDWTTVLFQAINFLILMVLLKHFLYDRIIKAMAERERKIASRVEEADRKKEAADREAASYRSRQQALEEQQQSAMKKAREEAEAGKKEMMEAAREAVDRQKNAWLESLRKEKETFLKSFQRTVVSQAAAISRQALIDLADTDLTGRTAHVFLNRLGDLDGAQLGEMKAALAESNAGVVVESSHDLSVEIRERIAKTLKEVLQQEVEPRYQTDSRIIMGLELKVGGRKVAWSLDEYIDGVEKNALDVLNELSDRGDA